LDTDRHRHGHRQRRKEGFVIQCPTMLQTSVVDYDEEGIW